MKSAPGDAKPASLSDIACFGRRKGDWNADEGRWGVRKVSSRRRKGDLGPSRAVISADEASGNPGGASGGAGGGPGGPRGAPGVLDGAPGDGGCPRLRTEDRRRETGDGE